MTRLHPIAPARRPHHHRRWRPDPGPRRTAPRRPGTRMFTRFFKDLAVWLLDALVIVSLMLAVAAAVVSLRLYAVSEPRTEWTSAEHREDCSLCRRVAGQSR